MKRFSRGALKFSVVHWQGSQQSSGKGPAASHFITGYSLRVTTAPRTNPWALMQPVAPLLTLANCREAPGSVSGYFLRAAARPGAWTRTEHDRTLQNTTAFGPLSGPVTLDGLWAPLQEQPPGLSRVACRGAAPGLTALSRRRPPLPGSAQPRSSAQRPSSARSAAGADGTPCSGSEPAARSHRGWRRDGGCPRPASPRLASARLSLRRTATVELQTAATVGAAPPTPTAAGGREPGARARPRPPHGGSS